MIRNVINLEELVESVEGAWENTEVATQTLPTRLKSLQLSCMVGENPVIWQFDGDIEVSEIIFHGSTIHPYSYKDSVRLLLNNTQVISTFFKPEPFTIPLNYRIKNINAMEFLVKVHKPRNVVIDIHYKILEEEASI